MELNPFDKLFITQHEKRQSARVIGIKEEANGVTTYFIEPLRIDFTSFKNGARIRRITSADIEQKAVSIEKHIV
ncbi:MAG: hypothetical protein A2066_13010 [Bacteroidetes bacterium GWB2_41_8]|nr:MAG: hypothetical protein A2066_13010 [Bacteroidetes bacterium GWB2_41_8]